MLTQWKTTVISFIKTIMMKHPRPSPSSSRSDIPFRYRERIVQDAIEEVRKFFLSDLRYSKIAYVWDLCTERVVKQDASQEFLCNWSLWIFNFAGSDWLTTRTFMVGSKATSRHHQHQMDGGDVDNDDGDMEPPAYAVSCSICLDVVSDNGDRSRA
ncbi:hypothetical protein ACOSQ2_031333 [Xanthoceras sorbifolium]